MHWAICCFDLLKPVCMSSKLSSRFSLPMDCFIILKLSCDFCAVLIGLSTYECGRQLQTVSALWSLFRSFEGFSKVFVEIPSPISIESPKYTYVSFESTFKESPKREILSAMDLSPDECTCGYSDGTGVMVEMSLGATVQGENSLSLRYRSGRPLSLL